jgi:hypothetical protein
LAEPTVTPYSRDADISETVVELYPNSRRARATLVWAIFL